MQAGHDRLVVLAQPVVDGPGQVPGRQHGAAGLLGVGRGDHRQARLQPHDADVLQAVVAGAGVAVFEAAAHARHAHRQLLKDGAVPDELVRTQGGEGDDRVAEGDEARLGQPGRQADHVLLGHADVDEALRMAVGEGFQGHEAEVAGQEQDAAVLLGQVAQGARERDPHPRSTSAIACRYSSSLMGR